MSEAGSQLTFTFPEDRVKMRVPHYRRLQAILTPLLSAGFKLEQLLDPRPTEAFALSDPAKYVELLRRPAFICIRARR